VDCCTERPTEATFLARFPKRLASASGGAARPLSSVGNLSQEGRLKLLTFLLLKANFIQRREGVKRNKRFLLDKVESFGKELEDVLGRIAILEDEFDPLKRDLDEKMPQVIPAHLQVATGLG